MELKSLIDCKNRLRIYGITVDQQSEISKAFKYGFFNYFIPMPWELHGERKTYSAEDVLDLGIYKKLTENQSRPLIAAHPSRKKQQELKDRFGYCDSESWAVANWGTRWDINTFQEGSTEKILNNESILEFNVEDKKAPVSTVLKISVRFPDSVFVLVYRDSSMYSGGEFICSNGKCFSHQELQMEQAFEYFKSSKELLCHYLDFALKWYQGTLDSSVFTGNLEEFMGDLEEIEKESILEYAFLECADEFLNSSPEVREKMTLNEFMIPLGPAYSKGGSDVA